MYSISHDAKLFQPKTGESMYFTLFILPTRKYSFSSHSSDGDESDQIGSGVAPCCLQGSQSVQPLKGGLSGGYLIPSERDVNN